MVGRGRVAGFGFSWGPCGVRTLDRIQMPCVRVSMYVGWFVGSLVALVALVALVQCVEGMLVGGGSVYVLNLASSGCISAGLVPVVHAVPPPRRWELVP
ncbi:hypothetical protein F5B20DRAFT_129546 [Whalleya microplaca]|nr:hypothetical protein F5B20DRAFT_129546 [Whalleya microplaca]